ncbi:unnamed protein product [Cladocopium goreaui]|uniref:Ubiquitin-like domain-containing protein n=1 Tax=Cladocopium goreaui TaxID=2562237 RepID=A0A9P1FSL2_9DINO|nr:unnamed protein product [Cladocopium goreaui]
MATMNFHAELLNGRRIAISIPLDMTIRELKEELKDSQGTADEHIRKFCAVDILIEGSAERSAIVSEILPLQSECAGRTRSCSEYHLPFCVP